MKMKPVRWIGPALLLIAMLALGTGIVMAQSAGGGTIKPPTVVEDAIIEEVPELARAVPALTDAQELVVTRTINASNLLTPILESPDAYSIGSIGPWVSADRDPIGALVEIHLNSPTAYQGGLPTVRFEPNGERHYTAQSEAVNASGIRSLYIMVDLSSNTVVGMEIVRADAVTFTNVAGQ